MICVNEWLMVLYCFCRDLWVVIMEYLKKFKFDIGGLSINVLFVLFNIVMFYWRYFRYENLISRDEVLR